jgi:uncharacterized protein YxjI
MNLTETYVFPQFNLEIVNPTLTIISKSFRYADNDTEISFTLEVTGAKYGATINATNANGGTATLNQIETWLVNKLDQYKI